MEQFPEALSPNGKTRLALLAEYRNGFLMAEEAKLNQRRQLEMLSIAFGLAIEVLVEQQLQIQALQSKAKPLSLFDAGK